MFSIDFYPTPETTIQKMVGLENLTGKTVLEPSAGSGNILEYCKQLNAETIACEVNEDLGKIAAQKADRFLKNDFLQVTPDEVSHIDYIIMNPPFSAEETHIQHAWEVLPEGGQIISLCNRETLKNAYSGNRKKLNHIINQYGYSESIGKVFMNGERKTDVEVGLVRLFKEKQSGDEFEGFFDTEGVEDLEGGDQESGIMSYNAIVDLVNRYVTAVKKFEEVQKINEEMNNLIEPIGGTSVYKFGCFEKRDKIMSEVSRERFKIDLKKAAWEEVFMKMNMEKYMTNSVMEEINKFVEKQKNVPFTVRNIYKMIEIVVGTHGERMNKIIVEAFEEITKHYHENRFQKEGWKTNSEYRVNKKFILPRQVSVGFHGQMSDDWNFHRKGTDMDDINKALCYVTGTNFDNVQSFRDFLWNERPNFGEKYNWGFFEIRGFKKGTLHCTFKDEWVWDEFNRIACKEKGFHLAANYTSSYKKKNKKPNTLFD